jgi:hypothetical protein
VPVIDTQAVPEPTGLAAWAAVAGALVIGCRRRSGRSGKRLSYLGVAGGFGGRGVPVRRSRGGVAVRETRKA